MTVTANSPVVATPRLSMVAVVGHPEGGSQVGVIAKRTYRVVGQRCVVDDEQIALVEVQRFSEDKSALLHDFDCVLNRTEVDVVVAGNARPPQAGAASFQLRVCVGQLDRKLTVWGDRRCYRDRAGRLRFSAPQPVEAVPLDWTSSYGGVDQVALAKHGDPMREMRAAAKLPYSPRFGRFSYPRNRAGKGYLIEATNEALEACALPNIEEPLQPLLPDSLAVGTFDRWPKAPFVGGVGWLSPTNFPRAAMLGLTSPYDAQACPPHTFFEVKAGAVNADSIAQAMAFHKRLDRRFAQQSAVGMRIPSVAPGVAVSVVNAHPKLVSWDFSLAREAPLLALQMPGGKAVAVEPKIRTVFLQPERDRVSLVWVGEHREPMPVGPGKRALIKHAVQWRG
ncbi:MAG TPA: DUF2169 domain-containing protein [Polyangia bacterium]|nr:DUF2169 domain-containing protein [Polyangia bacterium]